MDTLYYDPWSLTYKSPFGAVPENEEVTFHFKCRLPGEIKVFLVIAKEGEMPEYCEMVKEGQEMFAVRYQIAPEKGLYFYHFQINQQGAEQLHIFYYGKEIHGKEGSISTYLHELIPYQLTCYSNKEVAAPAWYRQGIIYQIFPDRFANGNLNRVIESPRPNTFIYGQESDNPMYIKDDKGDIIRWDFYGGNLKGITQKIPYLKKLGATALYLNPIFEAASNHRYDTADYFNIDPLLGSEEDFVCMVKTLHQEGMQLILDGVFSHVGRNSRYFNFDGRYGENDGAARNPQSPYFSWFTFTEYPEKYKSWWGIKDLPEINKGNLAFRQFIYGEGTSVLNKWNQLGVDGWRLDVVDELPDDFIKGIRGNLENYSERVLIGEVWEDATNKISYDVRRQYVLGEGLHGVMNYPFRKGIIELLLEIKTSQEIAEEFTQLQENYPPTTWLSNLNNLGTHDTERILTILEEDKNRLFLAIALLFSLPGVPCVYYGDEAGLVGGKDPDNRKFFPWKGINDTIFSEFQKWISLRKRAEVLTDGETFFFSAGELFGFLRSQSSGEWALLLLNPSKEQHVFLSEAVLFTRTMPDELMLILGRVDGCVVAGQSQEFMMSEVLT